MKMWSGRFRQPLDPDFERWQRSFSFDRRLLKCELLASNAHARALKAAGILSSDELIGILQGLRQIGERRRSRLHSSTTMKRKTCITSSRSNSSL
jgi:argininosuccinate lyase